MTQHYLLQALFMRSLHLVVLWRQLPFMKNSKCATPSRSVTVLSCSFFGAPDPIRRWMEFLKLIGYTELLLLFSIVFAHSSQYLSISAIPSPTSNKASFVAGWSQSLHTLGLFERL